MKSFLLITRIRDFSLSRYNPTDLPEKMLLAASASSLLIFFLLILKFLISATLTPLRDYLSIGNSRESEKPACSIEYRSMHIFANPCRPSSTRLIIDQRNRCPGTATCGANIPGAAKVCRPRRLFRPLFFGRGGDPPPPAKSEDAPKRRIEPRYILV